MMFSIFCRLFLLNFIIYNISLAQNKENIPPVPQPFTNVYVGTPNIAFQNTIINLGEIYRGQRLNVSYDLQNTGNGMLEVRSIHSSCGCINVKLEPLSPFEPNKQAKINLEFDSSLFSGDISRTIIVDSNASNNHTTTLKLKANIKEEIKAEPALISLGKIMPNTGIVTKVVNIKTFDKDETKQTEPLLQIPNDLIDIKDKLFNNKNLEILGVSTSHKNIEAVLQNKTVTLTINTNVFNSGSIRENLIIWNSSSHLKALIVPIVGEITSDIKLSTQYLEFGVITIKKQSSKTIVISNNNKLIKLDKVNIDLKNIILPNNYIKEDFIVINSSATTNGFSVTITLKTPPNFILTENSLNLSGAIVIKTDNLEYKDIRIPFFAVLKK